MIPDLSAYRWKITDIVDATGYEASGIRRICIDNKYGLKPIGIARILTWEEVKKIVMSLGKRKKIDHNMILDLLRSGKVE